ncbi:flagellar biosynthetic protein FliR [Fontimonas thermophila]|uniref:Flagellar biosynthetic protein FliR n=1 Tax=Fontimonas thermophila TaxID=1076937 RepID=A0A1I2ISU6_9GAMM|nr:flagellar biosynthetic protein FliR [Fontimonas thermophila]SFF43876.1 flagellar biosynthetic protein FliR [Fontimonas thermophila]
MSFSEAQLIAWMQQYLWVFVRIGAVFTIAPVLGARSIAPRIRVLLALLLTLIVAPLLPTPAPVEAFSAPWLRILVEQIVIGVAIGFVLVLVFEAVVLGAELIAFGMGLSFAQLADPLRGTSTPVLGQFLTLMASLLFLVLGGHWMLIELIVRSFTWLPVGGIGWDAGDAGYVLRFAGWMFVGGLRLALPVVIALLIVNLAMGVISRSAPTLNLFAVGFPVTLVAGLVLVRAGLPAFQENVAALFEQAWLLLGQLLGAHP